MVKMGPTAPNFSGETTPYMGPNNSPMIKSHSTSGIFVRAKKRGKPVRQKDGTADKYYGERGWHILCCDPPTLLIAFAFPARPRLTRLGGQEVLAGGGGGEMLRRVKMCSV